ncbi:LLM class F420-dependent oxidoreductase [Ktedonosporobacter rubrisoli]|uniref:LLM class F420-dependent oxidoreductase n=2 Tax=Ktedonosporobacter rubrisoli TaxID=2509675 RepID=A0A4P6K649_KTERU|nr:LLM class F420-dependent oxidoreductase [Ktedonosporobacter rubrisoli]
MNRVACSYPVTAIKIAQLAEAAGFESLWAAEHIVLPDPRVPSSPSDPQERFLDPLVALAFLAAHTKRVLLGTGVIVLPQHNPLILAKGLASLDELSGGRLLFGVGAGYLEPEFRALGVPFAERGARTDEYLAAMRSIWTQTQPAYHGRFVSFEHVQSYPQPQRMIPLIIGGESVPAYRRAVEQGNGWYGFNLDLEVTARELNKLAEAGKRYERPAELGKLEISVTPPPGALTLEDAKRYAELGVDRLILLPRTSFSEAELIEFVAQHGERLLGRV